LAESAAVLCEPLTAFVPVQAPEAVQDVAFLAAHVRVEVWPLSTVLGLTVKFTVGAGAGTGAETDTVTEWVAPLQVNL
jgi:hypothetical protein